MSVIWRTYRAATPKEKFNIWLQWAGLKEKSYQAAGFEWCRRLETAEEHRGGILADEMGLGKTIVLLGLIYCNPKQRTLIVLPNSLLPQWDDCIAKYIRSLT